VEPAPDKDVVGKSTFRPSVSHGRHWNQGEQIGRIFAYWVLAYFGQFRENYGNSPNLCATLFYGKSGAQVLTKNALGYILGDFFHQLIWSR
jgi:hypothetical protein